MIIISIKIQIFSIDDCLITFFDFIIKKWIKLLLKKLLKKKRQKI